MLDLVSDWEPLPSLTSIDAASSFGEPRHPEASALVPCACERMCRHAKSLPLLTAVSCCQQARDTKGTAQPSEKRELPPWPAPVLLSELKTDKKPADPALACVPSRDTSLSPHLVPTWLKPLLLKKRDTKDRQTSNSSEAPLLNVEPKGEPDTKNTAKPSQELELQTQTVPHGISLQQATLCGQPTPTTGKVKPSSSSQTDINQVHSHSCPRTALPQQQADPLSEQQPRALIKSELQEQACRGEQPGVGIKSEPAESCQEEGELSEEEEGQISGEHQGPEAPAEAPAKRKRGERAGKRVRQRIAKRAREREERQSGVQAKPQQQQFQAPAKTPKRDRPTCK